jgi:hypothetical protein
LEGTDKEENPAITGYHINYWRVWNLKSHCETCIRSSGTVALSLCVLAESWRTYWVCITLELEQRTKVYNKCKMKISHEHKQKSGGIYPPFLTSTLDRYGRSDLPTEKEPQAPIRLETGWVPYPVVIQTQVVHIHVFSKEVIYYIML